MRKFFYLLIGIILFSVKADAQHDFGIATSDWLSTNSISLNPANIADSREKFIIDIFSINAAVDNNLGRIGTLGSLFSAANGGNTNNIFTYSNSGSFSLLAPVAEIRGPGFMINIKHKHSIALTTGIRGFNQFNNFDNSLYRTLSDPTYIYTGATPGDIILTSKNFNYTAQLWSQIGLTYGVVLMEQGPNELKLGVTLRRLGGIGYIGLKGNNLDAHYHAGNDSLYVDKSDIEFASNVIGTKSALVNGFSNSNVLSQIFGGNQGSGVGGDFGLVYEYRPNPGPEVYYMNGKRFTGDNRYKLRLGASVTDIGAITYNKAGNSNAEVTGNGYITAKGLGGINTFDEFRAYAVKQGFTADTSSMKTKVYMPTALNLNADYYIGRRFYINAAYIANLANRQNFGNSYYNQFTVTPRYDTRLISLALPVTYSMLANNIKMGVGFRISGFFIGSDDALALFASHQYGFNIYAGGSIPIYKNWRQTHADSPDPAPEPEMEHREMPDTTDNCPDMNVRAFSSVTGEQTATGTTSQTDIDTDGDGIPDKDDACPTVAGPASNHGCPLPPSPPKKTVNFSTTTIQMQAGKASMDKGSYKILDELAQVLKEYPTYSLTINGYTDNTGSTVKNIALSNARAASFKSYLVSKGIATKRIDAAGLGDKQPIANNATAAGRAKNRRVVLDLKKNGN
jgi:outer membrane protein OmpA-like peptidoglycan-associated protein